MRCLNSHAHFPPQIFFFLGTCGLVALQMCALVERWHYVLEEILLSAPPLPGREQSGSESVAVTTTLSFALPVLT